VAGPDAYRDLPRLIGLVRGGAGSAMNVQLSADETYADIVPVRADGAVSAFLSVMRGCNNMCSFCIVPFTRGRERSRPTASVLDEVRALAEQGVKEVTLLGQNVNSFADFSERGGGGSSGGEAQDEQPSALASASPSDAPFAAYAPGFRSVYVPRRGGAVRFAELLERVAGIDPEMRIRFTSPHPKDFPLEVLQAVRAHANVCKQLHLPAQSGASGTLSRMRRGYDREAYLALAARVREELPGVALSSDFISGFCGETEEEHADTLSLLRAVRYEHAFLFAYSRREKTAAARHLEDDVPPDVKQRRLEEARRAAFCGHAPISAMHAFVRVLTACLLFFPRRSSQPSARAPRSAPRRRLGACTACWSRAPPAAPQRPSPAARTPTSASCSRTSLCRQSSLRRAAVPWRPPCS
jgi:tRNA A37 methylthiotransferase MiaB